jgi:cbb3-type cytochrome oxidase maturation protein
MYFLAWFILVALSLWVSVVAFVWGIRTEQFSDPARSRYLPLINDLSRPPAGHPAKFTLEVYALFVIGALGLLALLAPILLSLWRMKG